MRLAGKLPYFWNIRFGNFPIICFTARSSGLTASNIRAGLESTISIQASGLMADTCQVRRFLRLCIITLVLASSGRAYSKASGASGWDRVIAEVSRNNPETRIAVVDIETGRIVGAHHLSQAARTLAAPGSTLKPLILYSILLSGRWDPNQRIACNRQLVIAGHRLACTHPPAPPFDAREALTWSCNAYFARVGGSLRPGELVQILKPTGLLGMTGLAANEAVADFREPQTPEEVKLTVLGTAGIRVTPLELAAAYRWLALQVTSHPNAEATRVVNQGLTDSASFGMAGAAGVGGIEVAGKTGTAESTERSWTHGWFAGFFPASRPKVVVIVLVPAGNGADAAHLAGLLLAHARDAMR
jgi:cell division protein FtsI/penicillin-binding protein 2